MRIFLIAILIGLVIRYISAFVVNRYVKSKQSDEQLLAKPGFNIVLVIYLVNGLMLQINVAILIALAIKEYIL